MGSSDAQAPTRARVEANHERKGQALVSEVLDRAQAAAVDAGVPADDLHADALLRLERKREFRIHLAVYVVVNALLWL